MRCYFVRQNRGYSTAARAAHIAAPQLGIRVLCLPHICPNGLHVGLLPFIAAPRLTRDPGSGWGRFANNAVITSPVQGSAAERSRFHQVSLRYTWCWNNDASPRLGVLSCPLPGLRAGLSHSSPRGGSHATPAPAVTMAGGRALKGR